MSKTETRPSQNGFDSKKSGQKMVLRPRPILSIMTLGPRSNREASAAPLGPNTMMSVLPSLKFKKCMMSFRHSSKSFKELLSSFLFFLLPFDKINVA